MTTTDHVVDEPRPGVAPASPPEGLERPVLLVTRLDPPVYRVKLIAVTDDGQAQLRFPRGGWMLAPAALLIDPPDDPLVVDRNEVLDLEIVKARTAAESLTPAELDVLALYDAADVAGLTSDGFRAAAKAAGVEFDPEDLPRVIAHHLAAGRIATYDTHRKTSRGHHASVRHVTGLGRLTLRHYTDVHPPTETVDAAAPGADGTAVAK